MKPISDSSRALYEATLKRAFGRIAPPFQVTSALASWPGPSVAVLRAAARRAMLEHGTPAAAVQDLFDHLPEAGRLRPDIRIPGESELEKYEVACREVEPAAEGAMALIPLAVGLRAEELLTISRRVVERAAEDGILHVVRKGGKTARLPVPNARRLFHALLVEAEHHWILAGEILSEATFGAQYRALYRLVQECGTEVGVIGLRPHLLRHAFAQRMLDDGANLAEIQAYLGHADISTTGKYLHPNLASAAKKLRPF